MHSKGRLLSFLWAVLLCLPSEAIANTSAYGEVSNLEESGFASTLNAKSDFALTQTFSLYLGAQWEEYRPQNYSIQRVSPLLGMKRILGPIQLFAEYRYQFENPKSAYTRHDPRLGVTGGYWRESIFQVPQIFSDSYGELISIPRIRWKPNLILQTKLGWRQKLHSGLFLDPYLEAYLKQSADPAMGKDAFQLRAGLRFVASAPKWSASLSAFRRIHSFREEAAPRWMGLATMGVVF